MSRADDRRDSISRALLHHELAGVVHSYSPPETGRDARSTWRISFVTDTLQPLGVNTPTAEAICAALAAAEWALVRRHGIADVSKVLAAARELLDVLDEPAAGYVRIERAREALNALVPGRAS